MSAREEIAKVLEDYLALYALPANYAHSYTGEHHRDVARRCAPLAADALLASPALANLTRTAKAEAWDDGAARVWRAAAPDVYGLDFYLDDNPHRDADDEETP